jgi:cobalt/nickel transport system permease protein
MLAVAAVLSVQALLFQDGGITAFGANFIDMGLAGCLVGYAVANLAGRWIGGPRGIAAGAILGGFAATCCGAALAASWLSLSGLYPMSGILPVMLVTHVGIGVLEAALTGAIVVTLLKVRPDLAIGVDCDRQERRPIALGGGALGVAFGVAAFVAPFASPLPDGLETTARALGFAQRARAIWQAPMPRYGLPWDRLAVVGPAVAGVAGVLTVAVLAWAISRSLVTSGDAPHR